MCVCVCVCEWLCYVRVCRADLQFLRIARPHTVFVTRTHAHTHCSRNAYMCACVCVYVNGCAMSAYVARICNFYELPACTLFSLHARTRTHTHTLFAQCVNTTLNVHRTHECCYAHTNNICIKLNHLRNCRQLLNTVTLVLTWRFFLSRKGILSLHFKKRLYASGKQYTFNGYFFSSLLSFFVCGDFTHLNEYLFWITQGKFG